MRYRTQEIRFRLTQEERMLLDKNVQSTGMTREAYLRALIAGKTPVQLPPMEYHAVIRELRAIGNNLHQIAHRANALGLLDTAMYRRNAAYIVAAADRLLAATLPRKE